MQAERGPGQVTRTELDFRWGKFSAKYGILKLPLSRMQFRIVRGHMFSLLPSKSKNGNGNGSEYLIEVRDVVKTFKTAAGPFTALKNVSLRVNRGEFVAVMGPSGVGKSFVALDYALCIATGRPYLGRYESLRGAVLYIAGEGVSGLRNRVKAWLAHHEIETPPPNFVFVPATFNLLDEAEADEVIAQPASRPLLFGERRSELAHRLPRLRSSHIPDNLCHRFSPPALVPLQWKALAQVNRWKPLHPEGDVYSGALPADCQTPAGYKADSGQRNRLQPAPHTIREMHDPCS